MELECLSSLGDQRLKARVRPSPMVSMLRSIRSSLWSFLFRASRFWETRSSAAGFTTSPLHSTFKGTV